MTHPALKNPLEAVAGQIAVIAPEEPGQSIAYAQVPWWALNNLRKELEARGFDWRAMCREYHKLMDHAERKPFHERGIEIRESDR